MGEYKSMQKTSPQKEGATSIEKDKSKYAK